MIDQSNTALIGWQSLINMCSCVTRCLLSRGERDTMERDKDWIGGDGQLECGKDG